MQISYKINVLKRYIDLPEKPTRNSLYGLFIGRSGEFCQKELNWIDIKVTQSKLIKELYYGN